MHLLHQPVNSGPAAARNRGFSVARGAWFALLDADDEFAARTRIEKLIGLGERYHADVVSDDLLIRHETPDGADAQADPALLLPRGKFMSATEFLIGNYRASRNRRNSYGFMHPIFRRAFLQRHGLRYEESNRFGEDFLLYLECLLRGARWWLEPEPMYRYTVRTGSLAEVGTSADLLRIKSREEKWLRDESLIAADPEVAHHLHRHWEGITRWYYYHAFTDAVKARDFAQARRLLFDTPRGFRDIILESFRQLPRITAKALRGGYRKAC